MKASLDKYFTSPPVYSIISRVWLIKSERFFFFR
jgi:hypothetical protein